MERMHWLLLLALFLGGFARAESSAFPDLSSYPQTDAFKELTGWTQAGGHLGIQENILTISAFFGASDAAVCYSVSKSGNAFTARIVAGPLGAVQNNRWRQLTSRDLTDLEKAIGALPEKNVYPPVGNLLLVAFFKGGNWIERSLDNRDIPPAMRDIYDILGESFETVQQRTGHT